MFQKTAFFANSQDPPKSDGYVRKGKNVLGLLVFNYNLLPNSVKTAQDQPMKKKNNVDGDNGKNNYNKCARSGVWQVIINCVMARLGSSTLIRNVNDGVTLKIMIS